MQALGDTQTWVSSASYPAGTVVPAGTYDFNYWITANGAANVTALQAFGYNSNGCTAVVPIVAWTTVYVNGYDQHTTATTALATTLPVGGPYVFCWTVTATAVTGQGVQTAPQVGVPPAADSCARHAEGVGDRGLG